MELRISAKAGVYSHCSALARVFVERGEQMGTAAALEAKHTRVFPSLHRRSGRQPLMDPDQVIDMWLEAVTTSICAVVPVEDTRIPLGRQYVRVREHLVRDHRLKRRAGVGVVILDKRDGAQRI